MKQQCYCTLLSQSRCEMPVNERILDIWCLLTQEFDHSLFWGVFLHETPCRLFMGFKTRFTNIYQRSQYERGLLSLPLLASVLHKSCHGGLCRSFICALRSEVIFQKFLLWGCSHFLIIFPLLFISSILIFLCQSTGASVFDVVCPPFL